MSAIDIFSTSGNHSDCYKSVTLKPAPHKRRVIIKDFFRIGRIPVVPVHRIKNVHKNVENDRWK